MIIYRRLLPVLTGILLLVSIASAQQPKPKAEPFELTAVRLLDGPFRDAMERDHKYLLSLDPDRLLHNFRVTTGLPSSAKPLGGWEKPDCELRGHSVGHYLSACALMYSSTGDARLKERADYIVAELARCQEALPSKGYNRGFLSAYPESFFDRVDNRKPVWAPYYTLHKIMAGLLDVYEQCGNRQALDVIEKMAGWLKFRVDRLSVEQMQRALGNEHGGMNEVLANLYAVTHNPDHLKLAEAFNHRAVFDPLARGEDRLNGLHANTQIPKIIGAAREYELTGEDEYSRIAKFFWQAVALDRSYVIGGHSDNEHFFPVDKFKDHLSWCTAETCNTYNMLKLTRHLFAWEPSALTMDFYERALYNHILASQDPQTGMFIYFASLKPGHFKTYSTPEDSFWCCVGTGMENHAKYADSIYFHDADSLYVNLFIASELNWKEKGLIIRQETSFPEKDSTRLTVKCAKPADFALKLRYPAWAQSGMTVTINGRKENFEGKPGSYIAINRKWTNGDRIDIRLPMSLHTEPLPGDPADIAVLYGPVVLAGELGTEGIESLRPYAENQGDQSNVPSPAAPAFVTDSSRITSFIKPIPGSALTFSTSGLGQPRDVKLIPFYRLHHQRYTVYWHIYSTGEWKVKGPEIAAVEAKRRQLEARTMDRFEPGNPQSETDHKFQGEQSRAGDFRNLKWREAAGGWFSWNMKVRSEEPLVLRCTYWAGETQKDHTFSVAVEGRKLAEQNLATAGTSGQFITVDYPVPADLIKGKQSLTIRLEAQSGMIAGRLFNCLLLRAEDSK